jgi:signal-transduction protein with cAMP-binding, CBS, and nucleotidyltransferase domain
MNVDDVMTRDVVTVLPGATLKEAARLLVEHRISGLPVTDRDGGVLGVVSEADVLSKEQGGSARLVGDAMTAPARTIVGSRSVTEAARLMTEEAINRLPVVEEGRLVGIVTRADLVRAFVRSDAELAGEIRDGVVARAMRLDRNSVQVEVADGEVTLTGRVGDSADAELLQGLAGRVPGVVAVRSRLTWSDSDVEC